ncbi:MAG: hypothetical protein AAB372_02185 [Patescibacteria group bacterium]
MLFRKNKERLKLIDEIIADLKTLRTSGFENQYAVEANIRFFEAIKTVRGYIHWLRNERKKLDGSKLLELSDFPLGHGRWESILQEDLREIERWKFPDVLMNLRKALFSIIKELRTHKENLFIVSLGSGTMEIDRQLVLLLQKENFSGQIIFVGIDLSDTSLGAAKDNLTALGSPTILLNNWESDTEQKMRQQYAEQHFIFILLKMDALKLDEIFNRGEKNIDLLFYSRFRHHLNTVGKEKLELLTTKIAHTVLEHDDLNNLFQFTVPLILRSRWFHPVLLNGAMFSSLRDPSKQELMSNKKENETLLVYPNEYIRQRVTS